jgi:hypothetical protein
VLLAGEQSAAANTTTAGEKILNFNASDKAGNDDVPSETPDVASMTVTVTCRFNAPNGKLGRGVAVEHVIVGATVSTL